MKTNLIKNTLITGVLCTALVVPAFAQVENATPISAEDNNIIPISIKFDHWSEIYVDQLSMNYDIEAIYNEKDLDASISVEDFENLIKLTIDKEYDTTLDTMSREAVVYELTKIWAEKVEKDLDKIPVIKMLIYPDTDRIDAKYNHGITVAYMRNIAKGRDSGVFDPKTDITYGEMATLINNTIKAIEDESKPKQSIVAGRFETRGSYELKDDKIIFDFELMSHFTESRELMFGSGQQYEITITNEDGEEVYRYSDDRFFTLALVYKTIEPGQSIKWQEEWDMTNKDGEKLSSGNYKAKIEVIVSSEEEKIDKNQLTKIIEFNLED